MPPDKEGTVPESEPLGEGSGEQAAEASPFKEHVRDYCTNLRALHEYTSRIPDIRLYAENELLTSHRSVFEAIASCFPLEVERGGPTLETLFYDSIERDESGRRLRLPVPELDKQGRRWIRPIGGCEFVPFDEFVRGVYNIVSGFTRIRRQTEYAARSVVTTLVSVSESFLAAVLEDYFRAKPDALMTKNPAIPFSVLKEMGSVGDATDYLVEQFVRVEMLKGSLADLHARLAGEPLRLCSTDVMQSQVDQLIPVAREVFERRHLYTHSDGIINERYIAQLPEDARDKFRVGRPLPGSLRYLRLAINSCEIVFLLLGLELWRKANRRDSSRSDQLNTEIVYPLLLDQRWQVAEAVTAFMLADKACTGSDREIASVNHWLCRKRRGNFDEVVEDVRAFKPSATPSPVALAQLGLLEDGRRFFRMLRSLTKSGEVQYVHVNEWPVLDEMRRRPAYKRYQRDMVPSPEEVLAALQETYDDGDQPPVE